MLKEPIFLEPVFKDYIWGGTRLKSLMHKNSPYEKTAESWEVSTNENGKCVIKNGTFAGQTLYDVFENTNYRKDLFGLASVSLSKFPLLVKFIDAETNLSVQVHPDDTYAKEHENSDGKTEMWYIVDCADNAQIICGMKENVKPEELSSIINSSHIQDYLNFVSVHPGDVIYIPSGTIHAILGNTLICEIQQNSDLTYRVYDWERVGKDGKPRQLHIQKAIDVINLNNQTQPKDTNFITEGKKNIITSPYFKTDKIVVKNIFYDTSSLQSFYILTIVKGSGKLVSHSNSYPLSFGDSVIIPSNLSIYSLEGSMEVLKTYLV